MKKFAEIRKLKEDYGVPMYRTGPVSSDNAADTVDIASFDFGNPKVIEKLNAFLGSAAAKPVIDPQYVLRDIQRKLSIVGLQFNIPTTPTSRENLPTNIPLTWLGGRQGVLDTNYTIGKDDGITHKFGKGLSLKIEYAPQITGLTTVIPKIEFV